MQQRFGLVQAVDNCVHAVGGGREEIRDGRKHVAAGKALELAHDKSRRLAGDLHRNPPGRERRREQPSRSSRIEQANQPRGRLQELEGVRCGGSVHDLELEGAGLMKIVKLLERGESFGAGELGGQAFVEWIVENPAALRRVGNKALDDGVPGAGHVEYHRGEPKPLVKSGRGKLAAADSGWLAAQAGQAERVTQALGRIDGYQRGVEIGRCAREAERRGDSRLTDAAGAEQNRNRALCEQVFQAAAPSQSHDSRRGEWAHR